MDEALKKTITRMLNYSFQPIGYEYRNLTENEKALVTEKEFADLVDWLRANS